MAYDLHLADRINAALTTINPPELISKKMFGGVGYMVQGNMACGILDNKLIVRVGKDVYDSMLAKSEVSVFNTTGKELTGWVMVNVSAITADADLIDWVATDVAFARNLQKYNFSKER